MITQSHVVTWKLLWRPESQPPLLTSPRNSAPHNFFSTDCDTGLSPRMHVSVGREPTLSSQNGRSKSHSASEQAQSGKLAVKLYTLGALHVVTFIS